MYKFVLVLTNEVECVLSKNSIFIDQDFTGKITFNFYKGTIGEKYGQEISKRLSE